MVRDFELGFCFAKTAGLKKYQEISKFPEVEKRSFISSG